MALPFPAYSVSPANGGSIQLDVNNHDSGYWPRYNADYEETSYTAVATANPGWRFVHFSITYHTNEGGSERTFSRTCNDNPLVGQLEDEILSSGEIVYRSTGRVSYNIVTSVVAVFAADSPTPPGFESGVVYNISVSPSPHCTDEGCSVSPVGTVYISGSAGSYPSAREAEADDANLWNFRRWLKDGLQVSTNVRYQFAGGDPCTRPPTQHTIVAEFWPTDTGALITEGAALLLNHEGTAILYDGDR